MPEEGQDVSSGHIELKGVRLAFDTFLQCVDLGIGIVDQLVHLFA